MFNINKHLSSPGGRLKLVICWLCAAFLLILVIFTIQFFRFERLVGKKCVLEEGQLTLGRELIVESVDMVLDDHFPGLSIRLKFSNPDVGKGIVEERNFSFWEYGDISIHE